MQIALKGIGQNLLALAGVIPGHIAVKLIHTFHF